MDDKELWKLISIICEGQDSEQRREVEQYITDLQKEIERLNNIISELEKFICDLEIECNIDNSMWGVAVIIHNKLKELKESNKQ